MDPFRRKYKELTDAQAGRIEVIKIKAQDLLDEIARCEDSRERSLGITKLEEAVMWVVKGITN